MITLAFATQAAAQLSVSASVNSDQRYRGGSISDKRPTASVAAFYDHASGGYLGGSVLAVDTERYGPRLLGTVVYGGYARRLSPTVALDIGASHSEIDYYRFGRRAFDYSEAYVGLQGERASVRVHYSPDYFRSGLKTLYVELNGSVRLGDNWRLAGHMGVLEPVGGRRILSGRRERFDASLSAARMLGPAELSVTVSGVTPKAAGRYLRGLERPAVVVAASYAF